MLKKELFGTNISLLFFSNIPLDNNTGSGRPSNQLRLRKKGAAPSKAVGQNKSIRPLRLKKKRAAPSTQTKDLSSENESNQGKF